MINWDTPLVGRARTTIGETLLSLHKGLEGIHIIEQGGKIVYKDTFVTDHEITEATAMGIAEGGRCRWKIENENNNTLKTKGYRLEHNFGHGKENLCSVLASLNILAFLMHTFRGYS